MSGNSVYLGNPNLKKADVQQNWTKKSVEEYTKCMEDPTYFIQNYVKIVSIDEGLVPFSLWDFQKEIIDTFHNNRFTICKLPRQSGKSTTIIAYLLHYVLFNPTVNVAILANKAAVARDLLSRLQLAYEHLPKWLQQGVMSWNKGSLELENGSKILASSTSASAVRGGSYNIIFLDEFAYVPSNVAEQFFSSVYPTISSGKTSKVMIVSTPHGMNMFYKMWTDSENKRNSYIPIEVHWSQVPGRDVTWKEETIKNTSESQFNTEFECVSGDTKITLKDSDTGKIFNVNIEYLMYIRYQKTTSKTYEVLSPSGFVNFSGIQTVPHSKYRHFIFDDGTELKCSLNHRFGKDEILASSLWRGAELQGKQILYAEDIEEDIDLYDLLNVGGGNLYYTNGLVSHNCEFLGSIDTLITSTKLKTLTYKNPVQSNAGIDLYKKPQENHTYMLTADVSRGTSNDYSAFLVFDITEMPYTIVAKYRDNEIKPLIFPSKIYNIARVYNQAFVLVEVNDIGEQVANTLQFDLEYDNLVMSSMRGRAGQILGGGFSGGRAQLGVRTTKAVKKIGCSNLKQMIEDNKLIVEDYDIINELSTFIVKGSSFQADDGCTDDLVSCLFIFSWATDQTYFKELTDVDVRKTMMREQQDALEQDMAPFGFVVTGLEDENIGEVIDEYGTRWNPVVRDYGSNW